MKTIHLYFRNQAATDRYFWGDRYLIKLLKKIFVTKRISGIEKVMRNLTLGFDQLNIKYDINLPFRKIKENEPVIVIGNGRYALQGYLQKNQIIAGIALMTHPYEWPDLCIEFPVAKYLQHSSWTRDIYLPYYGPEVCDIWPAGIDTDKWTDTSSHRKSIDVLVYDKIMWLERDDGRQLLPDVISYLEARNFTYEVIEYGNYHEEQYLSLLKNTRSMIFLCEHESQGFACCEALSMNVPVFAWDPGEWLDPNRFGWQENNPVPASSVPFFDHRCGGKFISSGDFKANFEYFWTNVEDGKYTPREFIVENLTLKKSAQKMLEIIKSVYP